MKTSVILHTDGTGYWSKSKREVEVVELELAATYAKRTAGELRAHFTKASWDTKQHGLIYTDATFLKGLKEHLKSLGFRVSDVTYSEQGMQGINYVSLHVGGGFIGSWDKLVKAAAEA
jgi:hypothetical protein